MLRYRSIDLSVRNAGLAGFRPRITTLRNARCISTTPTVSTNSPGTEEGDNPVLSVLKKSKARWGRRPRYWKRREQTAPRSEVHHEGSVMTEAEYQRSLWEAQQEQSFPENETTFPESSAPKETESTATEEGPGSSQVTSDQRKGAPLKTLQSKLQESSERRLEADKDTNGTTQSPPRRKAKRKGQKALETPLEVKLLLPTNIDFNPVEEDEDLEVPALSYGLDRVLFNPGVYQIQDTRSHVYNFDPYLTTIMPVDEFDFDALKAYITSSKDTRLRNMAKKHGMKYCGSTSSMTAILSHLHYLLSAWRKPDFSMISRSLEPESFNFTKLTRSPAAAYARLNDGVYAIDADKEYDKENVLSMLGKSMEKLLTLPREEFEKYRRTRSHLLSEDERNADEAYHYTTLGDFLMRSQLDARDTRLPGTGVFDLKTRAVVSIRMDIHDHKAGRGYEIKRRFGQWESFEREYYDLIRSAFLKYSLQVRMGRMDGIFLAYHNTQRIFGFQYISLEEMDAAIHGSSSRRLGDREFKASVALLNDLMDRATKRFPGRSLRLHIETRDTKVPVTYFFVEPVTDEDMATSKEAAKRSVEKVQEAIMTMRAEQGEAESPAVEKDEVESEGEQVSDAPSEITTNENASVSDGWEDVMSKVEEFVDDDAQGTLDVKDVQDALEQEDLLHHMAEDEAALDDFADALSEELAAAKDIREIGQPITAAHAAEESLEPSHQRPSEAGAEQPLGVEGTRSDSPKAPVEESETASTSRHDELREVIFKAVIKAGKRTVSRRAEIHGDPAIPGSDNSGIEIEGGASDVELPQSPEQVLASDTDGVATSNGEKSTTTEEETQNEGTAPEEQTPASEAKEPSASQEDVPKSTTENGEPLPTESVRSAEARKRRARFQPSPELMGLYITVRNKVDGQFVERPDDSEPELDWKVEYTVNDMEDEKAREIYSSMRSRRYQALNNDTVERSEHSKAWQDSYRVRLKEMAKKGESYRRRMEEAQQGKDVYVAWDEKPLPPGARSHGIDGPIS
ncbi:hypothetical protein ACO1O0_008945 [Amphichorda felina]